MSTVDDLKTSTPLAGDTSVARKFPATAYQGAGVILR